MNDGPSSPQKDTTMLRTYFQETFYDMPVDIAQKYAEGIRLAILADREFEGEKKKGFFLSKNRGFQDQLYIGNIHRIEDHLYWEDEELADDDQIIDVVVIDGPVTRDGDGCSYGSKDHRDQILYANTIPQVVGHIFILNTPGGAASARIDYEQAIADCREKGKPTVAWVDGLCCSAGQLVAALCDRTIVMNGRHTMGCIGTMCAFWGVANGTVDRDGARYIELVSVTSPDKNAEYREATEGKTEKLQAELDRLGEEFRETVRQNRPLVKEEHLTGKTFEAQDVMGALVDEIGGYDRAIEAVFELADQTVTAARFVTLEPDKGAGEEEQKEDASHGEMEALSEQQRAAVATSQGDLMMVADGHVTTEVEGFFGPQTKEIATPKNDNDMKEETNNTVSVEEGAATAGITAQPAAVQESLTLEEGGANTVATANVTTVTEEPAAEEAPATEEPAAEEAPANEEPAAEDASATEEPAAEEAPATEEPAAEEAPATEEPAAEEAPATEEPAAEEAPATEEPATEDAPAAEEPAQEAVANAEEEIDRIKDTLLNAESMIAERDKKIALLIADKDVLKNLVAKNEEAMDEMRGTIEKLQSEVGDMKKLLAEKEAEIQELAGKPTPMVDAKGGIPADNGTGEAPKVSVHQRIRSDMSYEEIRALMKQG